MGDFLEKYIGRVRSMGRHPDKITINELTMLAGDIVSNKVENVSAEELSGAIESTLLRADGAEKLPIIYLMDSIMYNVRRAYSGLFSQQLANLFMDAFRSADEATKHRLKKLLGVWAQRKPTSGGLPPRTLAAINRRLDPNFDEKRFIEHHERQFGPYPAQLLPRRSATLLQGGPSSSSSFWAHNSGDDGELVDQFASRILDELQEKLNVPRIERLQMADLGSRPELLHQVYDQARQELFQQTGHRVSTPVPPPPLPQQQQQHLPNSYGHYPLRQQQEQQQAPPFVPALVVPQGLSGSLNALAMGSGPSPSRYSPSGSGNNTPVSSHGINWAGEWLGRSDGIDQLVGRLYHGCVISGAYIDQKSGLTFSSQGALSEFLSLREEQLNKIEQLLPEKQATAKFICRNWFIPAQDWEKGAAQVLIVKGAGFGDDDDGDDAMARRTSMESLVSVSDRYTVPVDESQPKCAMTGTEFEKDYDDEEGGWVYKDAIRPETTGPIYLASAYLKEQAKRKRGPDSDIAVASPAKRAKA